MPKRKRLIKVNKDSWYEGVCYKCPHLTTILDEPYCDTGRRGGQVMACRAQRRALVNGRYPSGRVRMTPRKVFKKPDKVGNKWKETNARLSDAGKSKGLIWVRDLPNSHQTLARRWVKQGRIEAHFVEGAEIRGKPVLYIEVVEFERMLNRRNTD